MALVVCVPTPVMGVDPAGACPGSPKTESKAGAGTNLDGLPEATGIGRSLGKAVLLFQHPPPCRLAVALLWWVRKFSQVSDFGPSCCSPGAALPHLRPSELSTSPGAPRACGKVVSPELLAP